ncbi:rho-related protein racA-like [Pecten maximus]|uniref:rho-related protein racA-like n=1 Tax=Pecten maximus TaxID=6579 RepID=UPI001458A83B|nr:rho-related protein racA-like [Pecten maximus]
MTRIKTVAVGDPSVGKTCLFISYTAEYPRDYVPTIFDNYSKAVLVGGTWIDIELNDTRGYHGDDYERLRPLSYVDTDVFIVCFSIENRESLSNVTGKWIPEIRRHRPHTPVILVACQIDLRHKSVSDVVTYEEGLKFANDLGIPYIETSAKTRQGLNAVFDVAVRVAVSSATTKTTQTVHRMLCCSRKKQIPFPPLMPPVVKPPLIEVEPSRYVDDWMAMLENPVHTDVTFVLSGQHQVDAHKIVLCSASAYFRGVFETSMKPIDSSAMPEVIISIDEKDTSEDAVVDQGRRQTVVQLSSDIKQQTFVRIMEFLYLGMANLTNDHNQIDPDDIADVVRLSEIFQLPRLAEICQNCLNEEEILNPSIGTCLTEETGRKMKELYFNKPETADVAFVVEGRRIYAHKSVLSARCETMAAMFGGHFAEGQAPLSEVDILATSAECFLALMEYLYTDHSPIEDVDVMGLVVLADKYGLTRLTNLCELYVTKEIDKNVTDNIEKADIDVIGLLHTSQNYNAEQLSSWCLHYISTNYTSFKKRVEFSSLTGGNKTFIDENQWPPVSYLRDVEAYERNLIEDTCLSKCAIL